VSALQALLICAGALFALAPLSLSLPRGAARWTAYGGSLLAGVVAGALALASLLGLASRADDVALPLGLPWVGARFHLDPLAAVFLVVIDLGAAVASLYALGYGRHETAPGRVPPFYAAFLGAMHLVVLAADAFTFLVAWELMSLASWGPTTATPPAPERATSTW